LAVDRWVDATEIPSLDLEVSTTVLDRKGRLLRAYTIADGRWRLPVEIGDVDPGYVDQLIAYEDKRFRSHWGVDLIAAARAIGQLVTNGEVVSGGSTLTMQVARLLEEAPTGSLKAKLRQVRLALALERRLSKTDILELYLTIAPFGGNIEGVRAASLSYFGKEPKRLTPAQTALLVALPQSPETRRPDRAALRARQARDRVLARLEKGGALSVDTARAARSEPAPEVRLRFPLVAPHLADRLRRQGGKTEHRATVDLAVQSAIETLLRNRVRQLGRDLSAAAMIVDHRSGEIIASVGSPHLFDTKRRGFIDMTRAIRSPGSTLKPLIYGLGFEAGLAHPETLIEDRPTDFGGYAPGNFDKTYRGTVSIREALQHSLNIPAVAVLDSVGPAQFMARMRRSGMKMHMPQSGSAGLAIGLGGVGVSLRDLVALYAGIARGGEAVALQERLGEPAQPARSRFLSAEAAWQVADILANAPPPSNGLVERIAFKTGTSYGYRDAWAIGFDGAHVIGIWIGRADAAPAPGILGINTAAPVLFEAFARLKPEHAPLSPPPANVLTISHAELPRPLQRFRHPAMRGNKAAPEPRIAFPPDGATVELGRAGRVSEPLTLKVRDGLPPFTWLADGAPLDVSRFDREVSFQPRGEGFLSISVIDRSGQSARSTFFIQ
jgi:penicillin-binding protein 1C